MNGHKAKEQRRMEKATPGYTVTIKAYPNNRLSVEGFPVNRDMALNIMDGARRIVENVFFQKAKEGKIDDKGNMEQKRIIQPDKNLVIPGRM
jgi:hypothetical protein